MWAASRSAAAVSSSGFTSRNATPDASRHTRTRRHLEHHGTEYRITSDAAIALLQGRAQTFFASAARAIRVTYTVTATVAARPTT